MSETALSSKECKNCGAQLTVDPQAITLRCAFCDSEFVIEIPETPEQKKQREDAAIILFKTEQRDAQEIFSKWIKKGLFKPRDLLLKFHQTESNRVYIPCFQVKAEAETDWQGQDKIQIREASDGAPAEYAYRDRSGSHRDNYTDYITASRGLSQEEADWILPFDDNEAVPYNADLMRGTQAEKPYKTRENAEQDARTRITEKERDACSRKVTRLLHSDTRISGLKSRLFMLPVWILVYLYAGKAFRVIINGQTGKIRGKKPVSRIKVLIALLIVAAVIAGLVLLLGKSGGRG